jgi:hypothetical protein
MTDFSAAYDSLTDQSNNFVSTQLNQKSIWNSVPGSLNKVSTSGLGFVWGINSSKVYYCQLPCSGQWNNVPLSESPVDLITDDLNVYILGLNSLFIKSANNHDDFINIKLPFGATQIFSTSSYIWIQDSTGKKAKLPKPGMTGNWITIDDKEKISSSSHTSLYALNSQGQIMKSDESLQTGWYIVPDYEGSKFSKVFGDIDNTALYGSDTNNQLNRCTDGKCDPVNTQGYVPTSINIEPTSKSIWMTTDKSGPVGNIFNKQDSLDYGSTMKSINDIEQQRDSILKDAELSMNKNEQSNKIITELKKLKVFFDDFFKKEKVPSTKNLNNQVLEIHTELDLLKNALPIIQKVLVYIIIATLIYFFGSFLGFLTNIVVFGVLAYGTYDIYFSHMKVNEQYIAE